MSPEQPPLIGPAADARLHVMTYNLRHRGDEPPHSWEQRRARIKRLLDRERPTLLGTQEGFLQQGQELLADLPGYDWIHLSRRGGGADESTAVYFDAARLRVTDYGHRWHSDTPLLMGSTSWGNEVPRMFTWVRFADSVTGRPFGFVNTHFDHESAPARAASAAQLRDFVSGFDIPVLVVGDFNVGQGTPPYRTLTGDGPLTDTWESAAERLTPAYGTFNDWVPEPVADGERIDWILATAGTDVARAAVNTATEAGLPPSDHWAVQALLTLA